MLNRSNTLLQCGRMTEPKDRQLKPGLLDCALLLLEDGCPPEREMQLCGMQDCDDGESCTTCWRRYLFYVAGGRLYYPYQRDAVFEGGMIG